MEEHPLKTASRILWREKKNVHLHICRLCLDSDVDLVNVYNFCCENTGSLIYVINALFPSVVTNLTEDWQICEMCLKLLIDFETFQKRVRLNDAFLLECHQKYDMYDCGQQFEEIIEEIKQFRVNGEANKDSTKTQTTYTVNKPSTNTDDNPSNNDETIKSTEEIVPTVNKRPVLKRKLSDKEERPAKVAKVSKNPDALETDVMDIINDIPDIEAADTPDYIQINNSGYNQLEQPVQNPTPSVGLTNKPADVGGKLLRKILTKTLSPKKSKTEKTPPILNSDPKPLLPRRTLQPATRKTSKKQIKKKAAQKYAIEDPTECKKKTYKKRTLTEKDKSIVLSKLKSQNGNRAAVPNSNLTVSLEPKLKQKVISINTKSRKKVAVPFPESFISHHHLTKFVYSHDGYYLEDHDYLMSPYERYNLSAMHTSSRFRRTMCNLCDTLLLSCDFELHMHQQHWNSDNIYRCCYRDFNLFSFNEHMFQHKCYCKICRETVKRPKHRTTFKQLVRLGLIKNYKQDTTLNSRLKRKFADNHRSNSILPMIEDNIKIEEPTVEDYRQDCSPSIDDIKIEEPTIQEASEDYDFHLDDIEEEDDGDPNVSDPLKID